MNTTTFKLTEKELYYGFVAISKARLIFKIYKALGVFISYTSVWPIVFDIL